MSTKSVSSVPFTLDAGSELTVLGRHDIVRIAPAQRTLTTTRIEGIGPDDSQTLAVGRGFAMVQTGSGLLEVAPDGRRVQVFSTDDLFSYQLIGAGPDPDHLWVGDDADDALTLVDRDLEKTRTAAVAPPGSDTYTMVPDGTGALLAPAISGVYRVSAEGTVRVTTGRVLATGPTGWWAWECDDGARCGTVVVDRVSGSRRALEPEIHDRPNTTGVISPDGNWAATRGDDGNLLVVDLATGETVVDSITLTTSDSGAGQLLVWTPGNTLLAAGEKDLVVYDPAARTRRDLAVGFAPLAVAVG